MVLLCWRPPWYTADPIISNQLQALRALGRLFFSKFGLSVENTIRFPIRLDRQEKAFEVILDDHGVCCALITLIPR